MPSLNKVLLMGNLTRDPELRVTPKGTPICQFSLAINRQFKMESGESREEVIFVDIDAWGKQGEALSKYIPDIREKLDHAEASTPVTFQHYTKHAADASFGTKFEGLGVSRALPEQVGGLYHAGSVGIIMSGWLGAINYGVIVANDVDAMLMKTAVAIP